MILKNNAKTIQWSKNLFQQIVLGKLHIQMQKNEVKLLLYPIYKK